MPLTRTAGAIGQPGSTERSIDGLHCIEFMGTHGPMTYLKALRQSADNEIELRNGETVVTRELGDPLQLSDEVPREVLCDCGWK